MQSDKKAAYKEAYEKFYLPFISLLYKTQIWSTGFSRLPHRQRQELFTCVLNNIQYMDESIIESVDVLYSHYEVIMVDEWLAKTSLVVTPDRLDEVFDFFLSSVLSRATWLAKKLHQPRIGQYVLSLYLSEKEARENR